MADITAQMVKEIRDRTGAPFIDCKKALEEVEGDYERAVDILKIKGVAKASKKVGRETPEGTVSSYIHAGGKIGVMVEVNCETDFVARNEEFQAFAKEVAMQIAAANPKYISRDDIPPRRAREGKGSDESPGNRIRKTRGHRGKDRRR